METLNVSQREGPNAIQRIDEDEEVNREQIVFLASRYGRYGYRRVTAMLRNEDWLVNHERVERIWH
jgi:hypothetical protein